MPKIGEPHKDSHEDGGFDEISINGLSGELADEQKSNFLKLTDTPASYVGSSGKAALVKSSEDGLEFGSAGGTATWSNIDDSLAKLMCSAISIPQAYALKTIALLAMTPQEIYDFFTWTGTAGYSVAVSDRRLAVTVPANGNVWGYKNISGITEAYLNSTIHVSATALVRTLDVCDGDGSTLSNPPDCYDLRIDPAASAADFIIRKKIGAVVTSLVSENIDLTVYPAVMEFYFTGSLKKGSRDLKITVSTTDNDANFGSIGSLRCRFYNDSASVVTGYIYPPMIILTG